MGEKKPRESRVLLDVRVPGTWLLGVLAALGVILVAAVIGFWAVNRIDTCDTCHIIKPEVVTYKQSAHYRAGVGCQKCHTKPGVFNYLIRNIHRGRRHPHQPRGPSRDRLPVPHLPRQHLAPGHAPRGRTCPPGHHVHLCALP